MIVEQIRLSQAAVLSSPNPVALVCTEKPDGAANFATVSWWTYLSFHPEMVAFAMSKRSYSGEMVRAGKKVVLAIPGTQIADAVMGCGSTSGRDTDKAARFGIDCAALPGGTIQVPVHSRVAIQCGLKEFHEVGDHYLYICEVEQVYGNEAERALFAWNGYSRLGPAE